VEEGGEVELGRQDQADGAEAGDGREGQRRGEPGVFAEDELAAGDRQREEQVEEPRSRSPTMASKPRIRAISGIR
jgi:hypothetical protein